MGKQKILKKHKKIDISTERDLYSDIVKISILSIVKQHQDEKYKKQALV